MYINEEWLAGFIEGDGCFSINLQQGGRYQYKIIQAHQKNSEPLQAIKDTFGINYSKGSKINAMAIYGKTAAEIYQMISPYLSSRRREQAASKGFENSTKTLPHSMSWFAGYYEAEGCLHTKNNGQTRLDGTKKLFAAMTITQLYSDETSQFCKEAVGFGRVGGPFMHKGERRAFAYCLAGRQAIETVEAVSHMLSTEKLQQLERVTNSIV